MKKMFFMIIILFLGFSVININALTIDNDLILLKKHEYKGGSTVDIYENGFVSNEEDDSEFTCQTVLVKSNGEPTEFKKILDNILNIMQFLAPTVAIVLTIIDYIKALSNNDTKKANIRTIKRISIAIIIVFLPMLLDLLFHVFGLYDLSTCGIGR